MKIIKIKKIVKIKPVEGQMPKHIVGAVCLRCRANLHEVGDIGTSDPDVKQTTLNCPTCGAIVAFLWKY